MRRLILICALTAAGAAHAQFANRHLGIEMSPMRFDDHELTAGLAAVLDAACYIDEGFEVGARVPFAMFFVADAHAQQRLAVGGQLYARYLFLQESLRPWAGLELDVLYIFRNNQGDLQQQVFAGPGASLGLEYFVTDTVSIGARTMFTLYVAVNNDHPLRPSYGGTISAQVYF